MFETVETKPDDTAVILYTSGTTGQPKGAELTHLNMVVNGMVSAELCASSHDGNGRHATAITLPLFHATAQTAQMLAYFHLGGTLVLLPRFDPAALLTAMTSERITHWIGVPTMYWTLLKYAREQGIDVSQDRGDAAARGVRRRADAGRADERLRADVRRPHHRGLRAVGDVASRELQSSRSAVEARHGRPAAVCRRHHDRERQGRAGGDGTAGRGRHSRAQRDEGVLQAAGGDGRSDAERLVPHRRHRHPRRRWLPQHRRSQEGHDSARRLQRVSARARRSDADAPGACRWSRWSACPTSGSAKR